MSEAKKSDLPFDVAGALESAFLMGIGVLEMTREKTGEFADELIERGKLSHSDARRVAERITDVAEEQQEVVRSIVSRETDRAVRSAGVATKEDLDDLRAQIAELKALIIASKATSPSVGTDPLGEPAVE